MTLTELVRRYNAATTAKQRAEIAAQDRTGYLMLYHVDRATFKAVNG